MKATIHYFETGTKQIRSVIGELFFGDAMFGDYIGVKTTKPMHEANKRFPKTVNYILVPSACIVTIETPELDEELYMVDTDSMKRSKQVALQRMNSEISREKGDGRAFQ